MSAKGPEGDIPADLRDAIGKRSRNERWSWLILLGWWSIVERLALIDDVYRQKLYCLIANDLESAVRNISKSTGPGNSHMVR